MCRLAQLKTTISIKEGYIVLVNYGISKGHVQGGTRPALVVSNNIGNKYSPLIKTIPFTSKKQEKGLPTHVRFHIGEGGLTEESILLAESTIDVDKSQIIRVIGKFTEEQMDRAMYGMAMATPCMIRAFKAGVQNSPEFQRVAMAV